MLRRSFLMRAALGIFVLIAILAVYSVAAPRLGAWQAVPLTLAVAALLALGAARHKRAQPVALKIDRDGLSAWNRAGALLVQGRISGCSQWSNRLLILALVQEDGRKRSLLLTADALPAGAFRELSVLGRRGAGA
ncbi:protein YgfX [Paraburkholderia fungorum]|uniref:protein YgfX n=1 Tax=Paraburkholderia fungorum TaxID=134537 RepID=UPI003F560955